MEGDANELATEVVICVLVNDPLFLEDPLADGTLAADETTADGLMTDDGPVEPVLEEVVSELIPEDTVFTVDFAESDDWRLDEGLTVVF